MRRILLFLSLLVTCWSLRAEVTLNFTDNWDVLQAGGKWSSNYAEHTVEFEQATVEFSSASKQTATITTCPVAKACEVTISFKDGYSFTHAVLNLTQWGSKTQAVKFSTSTDGTSFSAEETLMTNTFESQLSSDIADGVKVIKYSFTNAKNQIGIASLVLSEAGDAPVTPTLDPVEISIGESSFTLTAAEGAQIKYCVNQNAEATAEECTMAYTLNEEVPFETMPGTYYVHAYAEAEGYNPSDVATASYKVKDPNATYFEIPITPEALNSDVTSYIKEEHGFTYESNTYKTFYVNPSSGQVKGSSGDMFYIYNTTAIKNIDYVELHKKSGKFEESKIYIKGDDTVITENPSDGGMAGTLDGDVIMLKLTEPKDFFRIWFTSGATSGAANLDKIVIYYKKEAPVVKADYDASAFNGTTVDITLGGETVTLPLGETHPEIEFTYDPDGIVNIDGQGVITAVVAGATTVTATWPEDETWNAGTATFTVNVKDAAPVLETYTPAFASQNYDMLYGGDALSLPLGETHPANIEFTWTPEDVIYIATFNGAVVTALKVGTATVTATWEEDATWAAGSANFTVNVKAPELPTFLAPVADPAQGEFEETVTVALDFAEEDKSLVTEGKYYYIGYTVDGTAPDTWDKWEIYDKPVKLTRTDNGSNPSVHAVVISLDDEKLMSPVAEFTYTLTEAAPVEEVIDAKDLAEALELGKIDDFDEQGVSVNSYKIAVPLHVFATKGNSVYVTDNDIDNVGNGARIDNVPAGLDSSKQLVNVTVKYAKDGDSHFVYVSHEAGDQAAEPAYGTLTLQQVVDGMETLMHDYIKIANVYYDDATKSLNILASVYAGHPDATVSLNVDGTIFNGQSGYTDVEGYVERNAQDEPEFIITAIGTITSGIRALVFDGGIEVANGHIVAPEGSEVFTVGGLRVSAKAKLPAGVYVVRTAGGAAVKVMVK